MNIASNIFKSGTAEIENITDDVQGEINFDLSQIFCLFHAFNPFLGQLN